MEPPERRERDLAPVRRQRHVPDLAHAEGGRVLDRIVEVEAGARVDRHVGREGDFGGLGAIRLAAIERHAPQPPAVRGDERPAVGRESVAGEQVEGGPAFHVVALHRVDQPALVARGEVAGTETGSVLVPGAVHQGRAVGRHRRAEPRPVAAGDRRTPPCLAVVAHELVLGEGRVVGPVPRPLGQVDVAARRVEGGADGLQLFGFADQRDSAPAVAVEEPGFGGTPERAEGARRDQILAVRRPGGRGVEVVVALRDLGRVGAVQAHHPQVVPPAAVRDEDDLRAIGAEARLAVEGRAGQERCRGPALDRQGVEVAQQVEHQSRSVRTDIDRHPGAFAGGEADLASGLQRECGGGEGVAGVGGFLRFRREGCLEREDRRGGEDNEESAGPARGDDHQHRSSRESGDNPSREVLHFGYSPMLVRRHPFGARGTVSNPACEK